MSTTLHLVPLPDDRGNNVEAHGGELAAGRYVRWPTGLQHLTHQIPTGEAVELVDEDGPDSGWAQWDLATKLGDL